MGAIDRIEASSGCDHSAKCVRFEFEIFGIGPKANGCTDSLCCFRSSTVAAKKRTCNGCTYSRILPRLRQMTADVMGRFMRHDESKFIAVSRDANKRHCKTNDWAAFFVFRLKRIGGSVHCLINDDPKVTIDVISAFSAKLFRHRLDGRDSSNEVLAQLTRRQAIFDGAKH